ncbi:MAG: redoxin domain-containing protein [Sphingobacteriales bacterium]|nr:MAG: redoxin domain-containing protein [Sphingobacteriales bacterium]
MNRIKLFILLMLAGFTQQVAAKDGYRIQVKFSGTQDTMVYLAHYYGKPLPTIYKTDSARIDKKGMAVLETKEATLGGIYMLLLSDKKTYFEFLLNNGDDMSITADVAHLPEGIVFRNSDENVHFQDYVKFLKGFSEKQQALLSEYGKARTKADSAALREKLSLSSKDLTNFRKEYTQKHPSALLTSIFRALETPVVPEGDHFLPDGKKDTLFGYNYYKAHYWDGFNFKDDRLMHTPIYDARIDEYMNKVVVPYEDSVIKEADMLLAKARGQKELFKYTLWWLTKNAESSKIMGMDRVFVYLVENYYMRGDAYWLDSEALSKYYERASKIAPNIIGKVGADIKMKGVDNKEHALSAIKSKYTLLVFWDPTCGHCTKEVPALDSLYKAELKAKGVKIYAVRTEGDEKLWREFIEKHKLGDWTHVYDPEHKSNFRAMYDVYSTPVIYLLDDKKIIRGKRLDHTNVLDVIKMIEKKEGNTKLKS